MVRKRIIERDDLELADTIHNLANEYWKRSELDKTRPAQQIFTDKAGLTGQRAP